mmetsp:Transcript_797/g.1761  ORF Transcript_797/g.1761 Transcript_797/m.1761 type:complete len:285 (+) Transcript_797:52-906(+)
MLGRRDFFKITGFSILGMALALGGNQLQAALDRDPPSHIVDPSRTAVDRDLPSWHGHHTPNHLAQPADHTSAIAIRRVEANGGLSKDGRQSSHRTSKDMLAVFLPDGTLVADTKPLAVQVHRRNLNGSATYKSNATKDAENASMFVDVLGADKVMRRQTRGQSRKVPENSTPDAIIGATLGKTSFDTLFAWISARTHETLRAFGSLYVTRNRCSLSATPAFCEMVYPVLVVFLFGVVFCGALSCCTATLALVWARGVDDAVGEVYPTRVVHAKLHVAAVRASAG